MPKVLICIFKQQLSEMCLIKSQDLVTSIFNRLFKVNVLLKSNMSLVLVVV